ncbi:MAG: hypothetical protein KDK40_05510, partial [Chlamydiia bacterium]|nr:hypothetical protein [Chlamydiia bacterium]
MEECRGIQRIEESDIRGLPLIAGIKNFSNSELSREEVIKKLAACINSGQLRLSRAPSIEQLPDILEELGERLESVNLSNIEMTPELRSKIFDSLPVGLKEINLGKTRLTDSEIDKLARFPELTRLSLLFNSITDRAIEKLISLPLAKSLRTLSLGACTTVTDRGIELLTHLDELERLFLASLPHVTYVGISSLTTLPKLQSLTVAWCF